MIRLDDDPTAARAPSRTMRNIALWYGEHPNILLTDDKMSESRASTERLGDPARTGKYVTIAFEWAEASIHPQVWKWSRKM